MALRYYFIPNIEVYLVILIAVADLEFFYERWGDNQPLPPCSSTFLFPFHSYTGYYDPSFALSVALNSSS